MLGGVAVTVLLMLGGAERAEAAPSVRYECTPAPADCTGWYRSNVRIEWTYLPSNATVVAGCENKWLVTDTTGSNEFCRVRDGQATATGEITMTVDKSPPVVTGGQPARGADFNGWYNHPVEIAFSGSDLTSGIASCTRPTYAAPDSGAASLFGTCIDNAGNVSSPFGYGLRYDATAPPLNGLDAAPGDRRVAVEWRATPEAASVEVVRRPGLGSEAASVVFRGPGASFEDDLVANRVRYAYDVRVRDAAGNTASRTVAVVPGPRLLSPRRKAAVASSRPPLLLWTSVRRARYYNVQLFRNGRKILSAWPTKARYRLKRRWTYRGKPRRLVRGKYRWVVWPGYGKRSKNNYGTPMGPITFRVSR